MGSQPLFPLPPSPANGSSRQLSVDEMYLLDTGGQYLCVALPVPAVPVMQWGDGAPLTSPLQGRHHGHHTHRALGHADPAAEGAGTVGCSQHHGAGGMSRTPPRSAPPIIL